jgi:hypothetical protein
MSIQDLEAGGRGGKKRTSPHPYTEKYLEKTADVLRTQ